MTITTRAFAAFVLAASVVVLGGAFLSQYWGGLAPCELCLLQRWPWAVAIVIAIIALLVGDRAALPILTILLAIVFVIGAGFAFYHVGVEQHWFAGPNACSTTDSGAETLEQMKARILGHAPVMCDRIAWSLFGVSLAGWNLLASIVMAGCCIAALARSRAAARLPGASRRPA